MAIFIARRKLAPGEFDTWRKRFEDDAPNRKQAGCRSVRRFRGVDDRDELIVVFDWDTPENFRAFQATKRSQNSKAFEAKRPDGSPAFETLMYEEMERLES